MAKCSSKVIDTDPTDAKEELLDECENIWKEMEECQRKLMVQRSTPLPSSDIKLSMLMLQWKALTVDCRLWQERSPESLHSSPDVLVELGKVELQRVKNDLEMLVSTVQAKNKQLDEDLKREQQWYEEQKQMLDALNKIQEEENARDEQRFTEREFGELENEIQKLKTFKKELLSALSEFLDKHFPHPGNGASTEKEKSSAQPPVELITLQEILEMLINKSMITPHKPYITINESFWPPYVELLLRSEVALRHPEDPRRMRLQAFHK